MLAFVCLPNGLSDAGLLFGCNGVCLYSTLLSRIPSLKMHIVTKEGGGGGIGAIRNSQLRAASGLVFFLSVDTFSETITVNDELREAGL